MPKIIALCGYARVGKDTAAAALTKLGWQRRAFADGLKAEVFAALGPMAPEDKEVWRPLLVEWGRLRRFYDPAYWVKKLGSIETDTVVTDCRYLNEARHLKALGATIVYIHRPYYHAANGEEQRTLDEILDHMEDLDLIFLENDGTEEELQRNLASIAGVGE